MAEAASTNVMHLSGNLVFLAGGVSVESLYGAFVKSITNAGSVTVQRADGSEATVQLLASRVSSGNAFPTSPTPKSSDLHIFRLAVANGLTWKDVDGSADLTASEAGDVAFYDGTQWVKVGNLQASNIETWAHEGDTTAIPAAKLANAPVGYYTGNAFPATPRTGDIFEFNADVGSGITAKDYDGTMNLTSASRGDVFKYSGADWVKQSQSGTTDSGLNESQVDGRVHALVADWAEVDNTDKVPNYKHASARAALLDITVAEAASTGSVNVRRRLGDFAGYTLSGYTIDLNFDATFDNVDTGRTVSSVTLADNGTGAVSSAFTVLRESGLSFADDGTGGHTATSEASLLISAAGDFEVWLDIALDAAPTTGTFEASGNFYIHANAVENWAATDFDVAIPADKLVNAPPGIEYKTGTAFPDSPNTDDVFEFNTTANSISAVGYDGSTPVTSAARGDVFKYNGTSWVKQSEAGLAIAAQDNDGTEVEDAVTTMRAGNGVNISQSSDGVIVLSLGAVDSALTAYCGVSSDTTVTSGEATGGESATGNVVTVPTYTGASYVFVLRPQSAGAITELYIYSTGNRNTHNQLASWNAVSALDISGTSYIGAISANQLTGASGLMLEMV